VNTERDASEMKLTPGGSATEAVHIARPEGHPTSAGDIRDLDGDHPVPGRSEWRDGICKAEE
jgi:hypothetical protein